MRPRVLVVSHDLGELGSGEHLIGPMCAAGAAVVCLVPAHDEDSAARCLGRGAHACVSKIEPLDALISTVLGLARGRSTAPGATVRPARVAVGPCTQHPQDLFGLTPREASVLGQLMRGSTVADIARDSYVSEATVRTQVRSILTKLHVRSQVQAVALAAREGWEPPDGYRPGPGALTATAPGT